MKEKANEWLNRHSGQIVRVTDYCFEFAEGSWTKDGFEEKRKYSVMESFYFKPNKEV